MRSFFNAAHTGFGILTRADGTQEHKNHHSLHRPLCRETPIHQSPDNKPEDQLPKQNSIGDLFRECDGEDFEKEEILPNRRFIYPFLSKRPRSPPTNKSNIDILLPIANNGLGYAIAVQ